MCPLTAVKGTCANKCKRDCKLGKTPEGTPEGMRCVHSCQEACPCEDVSDELKDIIRLIPDSDMAIPFAVSSSKHFSKKKPAGQSPEAPSASGPAEKPAEKPLEGLGFPIHLLPSVRDEVHKKPKASLMKMIKQALKKSKKVNAKKKLLTLPKRRRRRRQRSQRQKLLLTQRKQRNWSKRPRS